MSQLYLNSMQYRDLKVGDEFDTYHDKRVKRVFVVSKPTISSAGQVEFKIHPCAKCWKVNTIVKVKFSASATVEVYLDRINQARDLDRWYQNEVMAVMRKGDRLRTLKELHERLRHKHEKVWIAKANAAVRSLARRGALVKKRSSALDTYRLPLTGLVGVAIIENEGRRSQRIGKIVEWKELKTTGEIKPVVKWENGVEGFSSENLFEVLTNEILLKRLEVAHTPKQESSIIEIPEELLGSVIRSNLYSTTNESVLIEIGKVLGYVQMNGYSWKKCTKGLSATSARIKTVEYLNLYYPGWQQRRSA